MRFEAENKLGEDKLIGTKSNRSAIGVRVYCVTDTLKQMQEVRSGGSYISQSDLRLHFGLAKATRCSLAVLWPTAQVEKIGRTPLNQIITITEGRGITSRS